MKTTKKMLLGTICSLTIFASACVQQSAKAQVTSSNNEIELLSTYVCALDSFAMVMPIIGSDTESEWAADTVHTIAMDVLNNNYGKSECMTRLYQMNNYIAYGMAYFSAVISIQHSPELAEYTLHMLESTDSIYSSITDGGFKDSYSIMELGYISYMNLRLFAHLQNEIQKANNGQLVFQENLSSSLYGLEILSNLKEQGGYTEHDLKKISAPLEAATFFNTFCPLIQKFASSEKMFQDNQTKIIEIANYFDKYANPMYQEDPEPMSDDEFGSFSLKAMNYKVELLRMLRKEITMMN